jgi:heterodisulfide reductase subunit B
MTDQAVPRHEAMTLNGRLAQKIQDELGQNVYLCYQCVKCTSGCPVSEYFDWQPHQVMRALQLGQEDIALHSQSPWLCAACQTCTTRCPQGLDIAAIMEYLTREALAEVITPPVTTVDFFNKGFMREVNLWGRAYELGLLLEMKLRTHDLMADMDLGIKMIRKNKIRFLPSPARPPRKVTRVPVTPHTVAYYPGCSLHSTAVEFDISTRAVGEALDIQLVEPHGWVCCGSSAAHRADPEAAIRLPMENMALFEKSGFNEVTMPCAACFNRHKAALYEIRHSKAIKSNLDTELDYAYQDAVKVNTLIQTIHQHGGVTKVSARVEKPLKDLRVVCYYGCLLTRPAQVTEAEHHENPTDMDELIQALGAEVLDWSYKTSCCGAAHSLTRPDIVLDLSSNLIHQARKVGAEMIIVACPLCHANLDARQFQMKLDEPMPILYFTQLMALAFGLPDKAIALHKNLVDPHPLLSEKNLLERM